MIAIDVINEKLTCVQKMESPMVYLDHWAFMKISFDNNLSATFVDLLKQKNGTLTISYMNLFEFATVSDDAQISLAESFLNELSPANIGFIEVESMTVIKKEDEILKGARIFAPHLDKEILEYLIGRNDKNVNPYSFNGFLKILRQPVLKTKNEAFMQGSSDLLKRLRQKKMDDKAYENSLKALPRGPLIQHATRYVAQVMFNQVVNTQIKMIPNDWKDFLHSIVPISYCDIVLLDKSWADKANIAVNRLRAGSLMNQNPSIYSSKNMDDFWEKLRHWNESK